jgi:hypothetical protein
MQYQQVKPQCRQIEVPIDDSSGTRKRRRTSLTSRRESLSHSLFWHDLDHLQSWILSVPQVWKLL